MVNTISEQDLVRLTNEIWTSMLSLELSPAVKRPITAGKVSACVQILGDWEGAVRLDLSSGLARKAAATFLCAEEDEVTAEQIRDAVGELANMTAGTLKTLLPRHCRLSLPSVADGTDFEFSVRHGVLAMESFFETPAGQLCVGVLERQA